MQSVFGGALLRNIFIIHVFTVDNLMTYLNYQLITFILAAVAEKTHYQMLYAPVNAAIRTKEVITGSLG
jgi:hypothetical protein